MGSGKSAIERRDSHRILQLSHSFSVHSRDKTEAHGALGGFMSTFGGQDLAHQIYQWLHCEGEIRQLARSGQGRVRSYDPPTHQYEAQPHSKPVETLCRHLFLRTAWWEPKGFPWRLVQTLGRSASSSRKMLASHGWTEVVARLGLNVSFSLGG